MRIYNSYILIIAVLLLLTTVILTALKVDSLSTYYIIYILEALIVTELYSYFNTKARQGLNLVAFVLFGGLLFIVMLHVIDIVL